MQVWLTAYLELVWLAKLKKDEDLLIHAGASGVGTAAIQVAKALEAQVFVTAGSDEKIEFCKVSCLRWALKSVKLAGRSVNITPSTEELPCNF